MQIPAREVLPKKAINTDVFLSYLETTEFSLCLLDMGGGGFVPPYGQSVNGGGEGGHRPHGGGGGGGRNLTESVIITVIDISDSIVVAFIFP